jgi:hypothetical protein
LHRNEELIDKVKVLFIGSELRSGSTLLDVALGQLPSFQSCGEIRSIWREALPENPLCSCGKHFRECEFWRAVGDKAFGGWDSASTAKALRLATDLDRLKMAPLLLIHRIWPGLSGKVDAFVESISQLYLAIRDVAGSNVIVDSSKYPSTAILLSLTPSIDLWLIHLVRDSRGVAYSWTKNVVKLDTRKPMPIQTPFLTGTRWMYTNSMLHLAHRYGIPTIFVKYESFVQAPKQVILNILEAIHETHLEQHLEDVFVGDSIAVRKPAHIAGGNYSKMNRTPRLRLDDEWQHRMSWNQRAVVTALTSPLLWKYGYLRPHDSHT